MSTLIKKLLKENIDLGKNTPEWVDNFSDLLEEEGIIENGYIAFMDESTDKYELTDGVTSVMIFNFAQTLNVSKSDVQFLKYKKFPYNTFDLYKHNSANVFMTEYVKQKTSTNLIKYMVHRKQNNNITISFILYINPSVTVYGIQQ